MVEGGAQDSVPGYMNVKFGLVSIHCTGLWVVSVGPKNRVSTWTVFIWIFLNVCDMNVCGVEFAERSDNIGWPHWEKHATQIILMHVGWFNLCMWGSLSKVQSIHMISGTYIYINRPKVCFHWSYSPQLYVEKTVTKLIIYICIHTYILDLEFSCNW